MSRSREQFDPIDREGIEAPASSQNKDGLYQCKKHGSPGASPDGPRRRYACRQSCVDADSLRAQLATSVTAGRSRSPG